MELDIKNVMFFDKDEDFYNFCIVPKIIPVKYIDNTGNEKYYTDFDLTYEYNNAVKNGTSFVIKDPKSSIYKHKAVSYRTMTKPIKNLLDYDDYLFYTENDDDEDD